MKNDVGAMTLPKIKRMLRLRWLSMLFSILFTVLTVVFAYGKQVIPSPWAGSLLVAGAFGVLALACCAGYLVLNKQLAGSGL